MIIIVGGAVAIAAFVGLYIFGALIRPPAYAYTDGSSSAVTVKSLPNGQAAATIHVDILPAVGVGPHPDWLGYVAQDPKNPTAAPANPAMVPTYHLPAHALITVIVHNFDSRTPLRNPFFTLVQGTVGNVEYVNGKRIQVMSPDLTSHTFTVPDLGVSVPMEGVGDNAKPTDFETMKFQFRTQGAGIFRWQCIVPCGNGLYGNAGPMQAFGYMDGLIYVS